MSRETVRILGVPVDNVAEADVLRLAAERIQSREPAQIATVNAEYVMHARNSLRFRAVLEQADLRTPDGAGVVWAARRRGSPIIRRVGGSDLIWSLSEQAARLGHRVFLLGGAPGVAAKAAEVLSLRYPGLVVAGTYAGSPENGGESVQIKLIRASRPDLLLVAFGAPQQDEWIAQTKGTLSVPIIMGVGGSLDYVAGTARRAPTWMRESGLEWLFRLVRQPWRWRRMVVLPRFAFLAIIRSD